MPLSHILAPLIQKKADQIELELGQGSVQYADPNDQTAAWVAKKDAEYAAAGAAPEQRAAWAEYNKRKYTSFLQQRAASEKAAKPAPEKPAAEKKGKRYLVGADRGLVPIGYEKTPYDPRGLMNKPESKSYDPRDMMAGGGMQSALGTFQRSGDPGQQAFAKGALLGMDDKHLRGYLQKPHTPPAPEQAKGKKGKLVIDAKPGEAVGTTESGEAVDVKGRKLGYLNAPAMVTRYGDVPIRTGERNEGDVQEADRDTFARETVEKKYGKHLDEVEFNNGKFPPGYFKGMKPEEKENIQKGVQQLMKLRREEKKGLPLT